MYIREVSTRLCSLLEQALLIIVLNTEETAAGPPQRYPWLGSCMRKQTALFPRCGFAVRRRSVTEESVTEQLSKGSFMGGCEEDLVAHAFLHIHP